MEINEGRESGDVSCLFVEQGDLWRKVATIMNPFAIKEMYSG